MSPVYDVPSSYVYGDATMALSIGGRSGSDFGINDFVVLGRSLDSILLGAIHSRRLRAIHSRLFFRTILRWCTC